MYEKDSEFRAAVHKRLKSPMSKDFNAVAWVQALADAEGSRMADVNLARTAMWIHGQSCALRNVEGLDFSRLGASQWTLLAVAFANREVRTVMDRQKDFFRARKGQAVDGSFEPLLETGNGGVVTQTGLTESVVDSLESWLFDLRSAPEVGEDLPGDLFPVVLKQARRLNIQRELNKLWNQASWEDYRVVDDEGDPELFWVPGDIDKATLTEATTIRHIQNCQNAASVDASAWPDMTPEARRSRMLARNVVAVKWRRGGPRKIVIEDTTGKSKLIDGYAFEHAVLETSYLDQFMERSMPNAPGVTAALLLKAWHVLAALAMAVRSPLDQKDLTLKNAHGLACLLKRGEILGALCRCVEVDEETAAALLDFLTFTHQKSGGKGRRGLWPAPCIPVPGIDRFAMCLGALLTSNPLRKVECWLEKGGIDDNLARNARGDDYEVVLRQRLRASVARNDVIPGVRCAEHAIKKTKAFPEQVDLLIRLGSLLIVGEAKCWLFPADPYERWLHFGKLRDASKQARDKADAIRAHRQVAADALGLDIGEVDQLDVVPLVVTNQGFAASMEVDGCRVVDETLLNNYLGSSSIVTGIRAELGKGNAYTSMTLYRTEAEASAKFLDTVARPFFLYRFVDRITWKPFGFPTSDGRRLNVMGAHMTEAPDPMST